MKNRAVRLFCHPCKETIEAELSSPEGEKFFYKHFKHGHFTSIDMAGKDAKWQSIMHKVPYVEPRTKC